jgi:hypothetical protein
MIRKLKRYFSAFRAVIKYEGFISLICRGFQSIIHRMVFIEHYYVEKCPLTEPYQTEDYLPKVEEHFACIISTNREADELLSKGFNFGAYELNLRVTLDKGAQTCCIFINKEFAHMLSRTDNPRGKEVVDSRPFHVDFDKGDTVGGKTFTVPKFRRLGLSKYSLYLMRQEDQKMGYKYAYATITANNLPSLIYAAQNPNNLIVSRWRYIKIICFTYSKETKMSPITVKELLEQRDKPA